MPQALLFRLQDGKLRALEEVVASWKQDHEDALFARDVEELVVECLSCWEAVRRSWRRTHRRATRNEFRNLQEVGTTWLDLLDRSTRLLENVAELSKDVERVTGLGIEDWDALPDAIETARGLRERLARTWPWNDRPILPIDWKMAEESQAARARGEGLDVADLLARLRADEAPPAR